MVGNEAKIAVPYTSIGQMHDFASRYTAEHKGQVFDIPMLAMFCVAMRRDVLRQVGYLDEAFGIGLFEDDDYSRRVQAAGYRTVCAEDAFVHHYGQASFKKLIVSGEYQALWDTNQAYFESKWQTWTPHTHRASAAPGKNETAPPLAEPTKRPEVALVPLRESAATVELAMIWRLDQGSPVLHRFLDTVRAWCKERP